MQQKYIQSYVIVIEQEVRFYEKKIFIWNVKPPPKKKTNKWIIRHQNKWRMMGFSWVGRSVSSLQLCELEVILIKIQIDVFMLILRYENQGTRIDKIILTNGSYT